MSALDTQASGYVHSNSSETPSSEGLGIKCQPSSLTNNVNSFPQNNASLTEQQQLKLKSMLASNIHHSYPSQLPYRNHHHNNHQTNHLPNGQQNNHSSVNSNHATNNNSSNNSNTTTSNENSNYVIQQQQQANDGEKAQHVSTKYRVGYWWSEKKSQKLNSNELEALFAQRQCELVKIDLDRPLEEQGPFSLIVHKISDILVKADLGDSIAKKTISAFESYVRKHPETVILDPLDNNRALLDRYKQYRLIEQSGLAREGVVFTPPFVHLTSTNIDVNRGRIRRSKITFPLVCKPILAQGSTGAHQMCIIFNEAGLKDVKPPCVAQSFVNHNAKLFKLFVIKDKYYIMERPSLKNFQAGDQETVFFYSHDISKPNSSSSLTELDEQDKLKLQDLISKMECLNINSSSNILDDETDEGFGHNNVQLSPSLQCKTSIDNDSKTLIHCQTQQEHLIEGNYKRELGDDGIIITDNNNNNKNNRSTYTNICHSKNHKCSPLMPCNERLDKIVNIFSEKLGLTFYGIDIIIENDSSRYAIIDMNTFPGYDGVENFLGIFRDVVCDAVPKDADHQSQLLQMKTNRRKPTEIDSGIEST